MQIPHNQHWKQRFNRSLFSWAIINLKTFGVIIQTVHLMLFMWLVSSSDNCLFALLGKDFQRDVGLIWGQFNRLSIQHHLSRLFLGSCSVCGIHITQLLTSFILTTWNNGADWPAYKGACYILYTEGSYHRPHKKNLHRLIFFQFFRRSKRLF